MPQASAPVYIPAVEIPQSTNVFSAIVSQVSIPGGNDVTVRIIGGRAAVNIDARTVRNIVERGDDAVTFDLSDLDIVSAAVPRSALRHFANADMGVEVALPQGVITLDADAVAEIVTAAHTASIVFRIVEIDEEQVSPALAARVPSGAVVHQVSISAGSRSIRSLENATITVSLPFDGTPPVPVWRIGVGGILIPVSNVSFDTTTGLATFETSELGLFVVGRRP